MADPSFVPTLHCWGSMEGGRKAIHAKLGSDRMLRISILEKGFLGIPKRTCYELRSISDEYFAGQDFLALRDPRREHEDHEPPGEDINSRSQASEEAEH